MSYTPFARWRNFTLENLKSMLELYPDMLDKSSRNTVADNIEKVFPGYKKTAYQFGCQLGIESRTEQFTNQNYLYFLSDAGLEKYLGFWFKMYVCPNPYVNSLDAPICPFAVIAQKVLESPDYKISYTQFCDDAFGEGKSIDIFKNALIAWGKPLRVVDDEISVAPDKVEELRALVAKVQKTLPMKNNKDVDEFFERFSCEKYMEFYDLTTLDDYFCNDRNVSAEVLAEDIPGELSLEELGAILKRMYENPNSSSQTNAIRMFAIKYGKIIEKNGYTANAITTAAGIKDSYYTEVSKGINIYKSLKNNEYGIRFVDVGDSKESDYEKTTVPYAWYVGATGNDENGNWTDFSEQYIAEGRWENGWDDKFIDTVNSMEVGDRIAIKAAYTKKKGLPFNNCGQVVGVMAIKAIGVITENPKDGKNIKVQWEKVDPAKEWYGSGVLRTTVHYVAAEEGYTRKALLDFTFNNVPQDYSVCEEKYLDEDIAPAETELQEPEFSPRKNKTHPLNSILYGAPGTGKTYITAEYALAILENREVDEASKTSEQRKVVMEQYRNYVDAERVVFTTFHQSYGYEDFIQGLRPVSKNGGTDFVPVDGVFKRIADNAKYHPENNYVIIIDEINRANISKVFGELITLIEDDKRWGEVNALQVTLPSGQPFKIPNNLYIVGTMNSADKSISLIDTALRRRFEFIEVTPNASLIADPVLQSTLEKLNASLAKELDSTDLLVGHAYFIGKTEADLCDIFNRSIIPLLYEYFYDNSTKVKAQIKNALPNDQYEITGGAIGRIKISKK